MIADALLSVRRRFAASPAAVYAAFVEPALLERWFCPSPDIRLRVETLDARPGGAYRFLFSFPGGVVPVTGVYRELDPPRKIVFTWTWEPPDEFAGRETLVTVEISAIDASSTEAVVTHELLPTPARLQQHDAGWQGCLARLETLFEGEST